MTENINDASAAVLHPTSFVRAAAIDLARSPRVAWQLFRSNVQARHRRAALSYVWLLLPTLATTALWVYVQSRRIIGFAPTDLPYPIYVLAGTTFWQLFTDALQSPLQQLTAGRQMITRSRLPHEALILAGILEVLLNTGIRLAVLSIAIVWYGLPLAPTILLVPFGLLSLLLLGLSAGLVIAPFALLYEDVARGLTIAISFAFFLTPVIYRIPLHGLVRLNPLTPLLETTRGWLTGVPAVRGFLPVTVFAIVALVAAWLFQSLARPHVVSRLG